MKVRESGMPPLRQWEDYFDVPRVLDQLELEQLSGDIVEFGCGYGTFTLSAALRSRGRVHALDIEADLLGETQQRAVSARIANIRFIERDFVAHGSGLEDGSVEYAMLFNILHVEDPVALLREARRVIRPSGKIGVIHWRHDPSTPRGPPLDIRPKPTDYPRWAARAALDCGAMIELPPYHYGFVMTPQI